MLDGLHELLEFTREGLTVTDKLESTDEHVAFRTLVQPDGDLCVMIDPRALARHDFTERHRAHLERVAGSVQTHIDSLRRWSRALDVVRPGVVLGVAATCWGSGALESLLLGELSAILQISGIGAVGALLWPFARSLLHARLVLRRHGAAAERLAHAIARLREGGR